MHLLQLFPKKQHDPRLVDEFNRRMDIEYDRIRDFLILHYHLNGRDDSELWRHCRSMAIPDSLQRRLQLFQHSGIIEQYRDGLFTPPSWLSVFLGQGLRPSHYSPLADAIPLDALLQSLGELRTEIHDRVEEMPKHASFVARYANSEMAGEVRGQPLSRRVESVAVVGRDAPAWIAAVALQRSLGRTGLQIRVVELASRQSPVDVYAAVPSIVSMHELLGLNERLVFEACRAVPMVGQRFSNWAKGAPPFVLGYDDEPPPGGDLPFSQYWAKGALEGLRVGFEDFSLGSACARLGRVPIARDEAAPVSASYGYHIDAPIYSELFKQLALRMGIETFRSGNVDLDVTGEQIKAVVLDDGSRIEADLYVDASGPEARLIGKMAGAEFESWGDSLPCDRLVAASGPRLQELPAFSQLSAFHGGWVGLFPLQHRTPLVAAYSSDSVEDREIAELAALVARLPIAGDVVISELRPGIQRRPWIGNCVAVGEAAIAVEFPRCTGASRGPRMHFAPDHVISHDGGRISGSGFVSIGRSPGSVRTSAISKPRTISSIAASMNHSGIVRATPPERPALPERWTCSKRGRNSAQRR